MSRIGLAEGWTPEQIAGRLRLGIETGLRAVCAETIYGWIYRAGRKAERLWRFLTRHHARRRKRHGRASRDTIAEQTHISQRSDDADARVNGGALGGRPRDLQTVSPGPGATRGYAAAIIAASATIGPIIPPSIPMVLYALVSNTSIGYLFLGGIVPGLFMGVVLMGMNWYLSKRRGFAFEEPAPLSELPRRTARDFPALLMPATLLGGIYGGVTTPTEAAAAFYALLLAGLSYRALNLGALYRILVDSARSSAAIGLVIGGALILNYVVASENIPGVLAQRLVGLDVDPLVFLLGVSLLFLLLGCVLDATTIILVIIPLFIPTCRELVHFGVVSVVNYMIGVITPSYGILLFVITAVTRIPLSEIIREVLPFLAVLLLAPLCMILWPALILTLPRLFGYTG